MAHQLWYAGLFFDGFRDLAISSCLPLQCRSDYFMPMKLVPFLNAGLSVEFFKVYAFIHLQKAFLIFSGLMNFALWEIVIGFLFDTIVPGLWTHLAKYSENTMYGYLLHWLYLVSGFRVMGVFLDRLIPKPNLSVLGQFFVFLLQNGISVCIYFAVNSKLSAWLFQYLTQIPFWIMSCTGFTQKHQGKEDTKSAQTDCSNQNKSQPNGMSSPCHETSAAKLLQEGRAWAISLCEQVLFKRQFCTVSSKQHAWLQCLEVEVSQLVALVPWDRHPLEFPCKACTSTMTHFAQSCFVAYVLSHYRS